ncbi:unnamed protein product, partial [Polarella glacialis]
VGEAVRYLSRGLGQWVPAVVRGHVMVPAAPGGGEEFRYHLDCQEAAHPSRVMPGEAAGQSHER